MWKREMNGGTWKSHKQTPGNAFQVTFEQTAFHEDAWVERLRPKWIKENLQTHENIFISVDTNKRREMWDVMGSNKRNDFSAISVDSVGARLFTALKEEKNLKRFVLLKRKTFV